MDVERTMNPLLLSLFFLFGLLIGSFVNVVLVRMESGEGFLSGRSVCRSCGHMIRWYDNIPLLSFLLLRGRCRDCGVRISWRYPAVEAVTAFLFLLVGMLIFRVGDVASVFLTTLALGLIPAMIVIFMYDLRHMEIPVSVIAFGLLWTLFSLFFLWYFASPPEPFAFSRLASGLLGGSIAFVFFYGLVFFSRETWMGMGDAWLALILGLVSGWQMLLPALSLAFGSGALVGIALLLSGRKELGSRIPFGPFLSGSVIFLLLFGTMIETRFSLFSWIRL